MIKKNKNLILFILVILIVGCRPPTSSSDYASSYRKGTDGLIVNFLSGAPPDKIYVDGDDSGRYKVEIPISIEVRNKGAYPTSEDENDLWKTDKDDDVIFISGFDPEIISNWEIEGEKIEGERLINEKHPFILLEDERSTLEGKNINNPKGGYDLFEFTGTVDLSYLNIEEYTPNFLVTSCYDYETKASPNVCIDPRPFTTVKERKVCNIQDVSLSNQGAPVAITKIEERALSNSIQFKIHFKNVGKGDVIATDVLKRCSGRDKAEDVNKGELKKSDMDLIKVIKVQIGKEFYKWNGKSGSLDCDAPVSARGYGGQEHKGYARVLNKEGFIVCNLKDYKENVESAYTTPLYIEILYGYRDTISKSVEIIKVPKPK